MPTAEIAGRNAHVDVIVLGLGGMGSSAAFHLAQAGVRVLGLERFPLAHDRGSSHGETRLIRKAYFESPAYVPLLERAYALWDALGERAGSALLHRTGLLLASPASRIGPRARAREVAARHAITVEELTASEMRSRFPMIRAPDDWTGLFEPTGGYLDVERCVEAHANAARELGADLRFGEPALAWSSDGTTVQVTTANGVYEAGGLVITAGAWTSEVLRETGLPLAVHRVVQWWFDAPASASVEAGTPCFAFDTDEAFVYGFPRLPGATAMKLAEHRPGALVTDPTDYDRTVQPGESALVTRFAHAHFDGLSTMPVRAKTCLYTMTPDENFVIDRHPDYGNVHFAAGFSGHGFKFASVIGEALADLARDGRARQPIGFLAMRWT